MPEDAYTVPRLDPQQIRNERIKIASDLLALTLRDVAVLPVAQQQRVRQAVKALVEVQQWCLAHKGSDGCS
jgi:hypothetical protein